MQRNVRSGFRLFPRIADSEASALIEFMLKSARKLVFEPRSFQLRPLYVFTLHCTLHMLIRLQKKKKADIGADDGTGKSSSGGQKGRGAAKRSGNPGHTRTPQATARESRRFRCACPTHSCPVSWMVCR